MARDNESINEMFAEEVQKQETATKIVRGTYDCAECKHGEWGEDNTIKCSIPVKSKYTLRYREDLDIVEKDCIYFSVARNRIMVEGTPRVFRAVRPVLFSLPQLADTLGISRGRLCTFFNLGLLPEPEYVVQGKTGKKRLFTLAEVEEMQMKYKLLKETTNINEVIRTVKREKMLAKKEREKAEKAEEASKDKGVN